MQSVFDYSDLRVDLDNVVYSVKSELITGRRQYTEVNSQCKTWLVDGSVTARFPSVIKSCKGLCVG